MTGVLAVSASMAVTGLTLVVAPTAAQANIVNVARAGTATGSAYGFCNSNETPDKAIDGSVASTSNKWCSTAFTKYLEVDFGSLQSVRQIVIKHAGAGGESTTLNTRDFAISVRATTGDSWTQVASVTGNAASTTTHDFTPTSARYALLQVANGEQTGSNSPARIYEFEAYNGTNVALSKTATGSTACNGNQTVDKLVNGSVATTNDKWCSTATTKYVEIDLGATNEIRQFVVKHAGAGGEATHYNTKDFTISVRSSTSDSWSQKVSVTGNTASTTTHDITAATFARYIKLSVTDGTQAGQDHHARVYELEAYGYANLARSGSTSTPYADCSGGESTAKINDGDLTTNWCQATYKRILPPPMGCGNCPPAYDYDYPRLTVDLGATKTVTGIRVYHGEYCGATSGQNTEKFYVYGNVSGSYTSGTINQNITSTAVNLVGQNIVLDVWLPEQGVPLTSLPKARICEFEIFGY